MLKTPLPLTPIFCTHCLFYLLTPMCGLFQPQKHFEVFLLSFIVIGDSQTYFFSFWFLLATLLIITYWNWFFNKFMKSFSSKDDWLFGWSWAAYLDLYLTAISKDQRLRDSSPWSRSTYHTQFRITLSCISNMHRLCCRMEYYLSASQKGWSRGTNCQPSLCRVVSISFQVPSSPMFPTFRSMFHLDEGFLTAQNR